MTHRRSQFFLVNWLKKGRYIRSHLVGGAKMPALRHLKVIRPISEKCAVALPVRKPNAAYRSREHLTEREVGRLIEAALDGAGTRLPRGAFRRGGDDRMRDGMSAFGTKRTSESIHQCPLLGVKRTSARRSGMSAFDPKRTSAVIVSHRHFTAPHASIRGEPGFRHFDLDKFKIIAHNLLSTTD